MENAPKITLEQIQAPIADRIRSYERYIASILHSDNAYVGSIAGLRCELCSWSMYCVRRRVGAKQAEHLSGID